MVHHEKFHMSSIHEVQFGKHVNFHQLFGAIEDQGPLLLFLAGVAVNVKGKDPPDVIISGNWHYLGENEAEAQIF